MVIISIIRAVVCAGYSAGVLDGSIQDDLISSSGGTDGRDGIAKFLVFIFENSDRVNLFLSENPLGQTSFFASFL